MALALVRTACHGDERLLYADFAHLREFPQSGELVVKFIAHNVEDRADLSLSPRGAFVRTFPAS